MSYVFVKTSHDYADEFDCVSAFCMLRETYEEKLQHIKDSFESGAISYEDEFYFGTNEALQFDSFEDFENGLEVIEVSKEFADTFGSHLGCSIFSQLAEHVAEEDDEDDEDTEYEY